MPSRSFAPASQPRRSPFLDALLCDDAAATLELFELGSTLADFDRALGRPAILEALDQGALEALAVLVSFGADPNTTDELGRPLLSRFIALQSREDAGGDGALALLALGANPNQRGADGDFPLALSARLGFVKATSALIDAGAEIEARDGQGRTPLMAALDQATPKAEAAAILIRAGADLAALDAAGRSCVDIARARGESEVAAAMERAQERFELIGSTDASETSGPSEAPRKSRL